MSQFKLFLDDLIKSGTVLTMDMPPTKYIRISDYTHGKPLDSFEVDIQNNITKLIDRANRFLFLAYKWLELDNPLVVWRSGCQGGIRTEESNIEIYRLKNEKLKALWLAAGKPEEKFVPVPVATKSSHIIGAAIDLADLYDLLKKFVALFPEVLEILDLCIEDVGYTDSWLHIQITKFHSWVAGGTRSFKPY